MNYFYPGINNKTETEFLQLVLRKTVQSRDLDQLNFISAPGEGRMKAVKRRS